MEVKKGYKQTEIGIIPEDWEIKTLDDLFCVSGGYPIPREKLSDNGYCYLHYGDIHKSERTFIDVTKDFFRIPKLKIPISKINFKSLLNDGDIVFVDASEDEEGASKHIVIRNSKNIIFISGLHTIVLKSKDQTLVNKYKQFCFKSQDIKNQFYYFATGTKVFGISKSNIKKIQIPLPAFCEQTAIANVLSDIDALIESLEKLITKKRNIKQGAMQQLLTGKKRLPGFGGDGIKKQIDDIGYTYSGLSGKSKYDFLNGKYPYIPFLNILNHTIIDKNIFDYVQININEKQNKVLKGDLLFNGSSETPEEVGMCSVLLDFIPNLYLNSFCFGFRLNNLNQSNALFFSYYFRSNEGRKLLFSMAQGSTRYNLSKKSFLKVKLSLPSFEEQTAIAEVLSDMDSEIEALEKKLDKYKKVKQGMMQELLTGKKRLI